MVLSISNTQERPPIYTADNLLPDSVAQTYDVISVQRIEPRAYPYLAWVQGEAVIIPADSTMKPIKADWQRMTGKWQHNEPLLKAIKRKASRVVDLSAGLGGDAGLLAAAGYEVDAVERNSLLASLLALSGEGDTPMPAWFSNIKAIYQMNALDFLDQYGNGDCVYYFDPMYAKAKQKRLTRGPMQVIQQLEQPNDSEAQKVVEKAIASSVHRVVVKRSPKAPPICEGSHHSIKSKGVRFDIYDGEAI